MRLSGVDLNLLLALDALDALLSERNVTRAGVGRTARDERLPDGQVTRRASSPAGSTASW